MLKEFTVPTRAKARRALSAFFYCLAMMAIAPIDAHGFATEPPVSVIERYADLPNHLKRLVLFLPDPGQLIYFLADNRQVLYYARTIHQDKADSCNGTSNEMWNVELTNYGSDIAGARAALVAAVRSVRTVPGVVSVASFEQAAEGTTVTIDTRQPTGSSLCGVHRTVTLFRMGGAVVVTTEEYSNGAPPRQPSLARRLSAELGWN
jgi:hypothetical protein